MAPRNDRERVWHPQAQLEGEWYECQPPMIVPLKPKRIRHFDVPHHAHELTFSCYHQLPLLNNDRTRSWLAAAVHRARETHYFHVWAYVFMPEHVHLLLWPTQPSYSTGRILQAIKQPVARRELNYRRAHGPAALERLAKGQQHAPHRFWQDGSGYDRNVTSVETLQSMVDYIHNNPVRRRLVGGPGDWQWSSFRAWTGAGDGPLAIDLESFPMLPMR